MLFHLKIHKLMLNASFVLVYGVFFWVQLFLYSSVLSFSSNDQSISHGNYQANKDNAASIKKDLNGHSNNKCFRLNKRFEPSSLPKEILAVVNPPVQFVNKIKVIIPADYLLKSTLLSKLLRGPPAVSV